jgi:redox-sensitive bicupin YhaK (pirin superfamily)
MIHVRQSQDRGHFNHGWLDTYHTFSFADYYDPAYMGFRSLRVINEDRVQPGQGFGTHGHRDMEIITCVLEGALAHKDSLGTGSIIKPGELQRMSAGTGIRHSEFNPSDSELVHLYQIWLVPDQRGVTPSYEQRSFSEDEKLGKLRLVASPDGAGLPGIGLLGRGRQQTQAEHADGTKGACLHRWSPDDSPSAHFPGSPAHGQRPPFGVT